jgi:hypothetical protein
MTITPTITGDDDDDDDDDDDPSNDIENVPDNDVNNANDYVDIAGVIDDNNDDPVIAIGDNNDDPAEMAEESENEEGDAAENLPDDDNDATEGANEEADQEFYDNDNEAAEVNVDEAITDGNNQPNEQRNNLDRDMDQRYGERLAPYNLRARKPRDYGHIHATLEHTVMTQHSMKRGIKEFGEAGVNAVLKELQQLHDRKVLEPVSSDNITREEKRASLQYLMFLKKKRNGTIKGRGCADGRKQRLHTTKEEASSPTVAIEAVMLSCVIDAMEGRDVATVDIPGAFMQADMDEMVHMKLEGKMAELLVPD